MKRTIIGLCMAAGMAAVASAQQSDTGSTPATSGQGTPATRSMASADAAKPMSLTGCLQRESDGTFKLTNAQMASTSSGSSGALSGGTAAVGSTAGTSGTASGGSSAIASTWVLNGTGLDTHVGHKVTVTGKQGMKSSTSGGGATPSAAGTAGDSRSSMTASQFDVQSVQMVASTCP